MLSLIFRQYEAKTRLESMTGSSAISSAELFGDEGDHKGMKKAHIKNEHIKLIS